MTFGGPGSFSEPWTCSGCLERSSTGVGALQKSRRGSVTRGLDGLETLCGPLRPDLPFLPSSETAEVRAVDPAWALKTSSCVGGEEAGGAGCALNISREPPGLAAPGLAPSALCSASFLQPCLAQTSSRPGPASCTAQVPHSPAAGCVARNGSSAATRLSSPALRGRGHLLGSQFTTVKRGWRGHTRADGRLWRRWCR